MNIDYKFKFIIIGDSGTGKSSIINRFMDEYYHQDEELNTIGVDFKTKILCVNKSILKLFIWDTAGQEIYRSIIRNYYNNAIAVILVFSHDDIDSFYNCEKWIKDIKNSIQNDNIQIILVGNKIDLESKINKRDIYNFCDKYKVDYLGVSVKKNINIDKIFINLSKKILFLKCIDKELFEKLVFGDKHVVSIQKDTTIIKNLNLTKRCCFIQ